MRIVRNIIVPAVLAIGVAGSVFSGPAVTAVTGSGAAHPVTAAVPPVVVYHG
jgi:hypothetical protein